MGSSCARTARRLSTPASRGRSRTRGSWRDGGAKNPRRGAGRPVELLNAMRVLVTRPRIRRRARRKRLAALGHRLSSRRCSKSSRRGARRPRGPFDLIAGRQRPGFRRTCASRAGLARGCRCSASARKPPKRAGRWGFASRSSRRRAEALAARLAAKAAPDPRSISPGRERKACWKTACAPQAGASKSWKPMTRGPSRPGRRTSAAALDNGEIDAVLHYSPRSAATALGLIGAGAASRLAPCLPSPKTSPRSAAPGRRRKRSSRLLNRTKNR